MAQPITVDEGLPLSSDDSFSKPSIENSRKPNFAKSDQTEESDGAKLQ